ncbi:MAG: hypothetical protein IJF04_03015 [Oscillospiraceae bacterium]|nr:hypothetical protein [Oscillospiraceae bacterium]MBQ3561032.1 hypothetical protein [Oscillospiraceae bacterium]MBQ4118124.1 hypothetical protein [Oscillospiraceae bacterium]
MDNLNEKIENEVLEVAEELPEEVANEEKEMKEENEENFFQKIKKYATPKNIIVIVSVLITLVATLVITINVTSCNHAVKRWMKAHVEDDVKVMAKLAPYDFEGMGMDMYNDAEEFFEEMSYDLDADIENWNDFYKEVKKQKKEELKDEYGRCKIAVTVGKTKDISIARLKEDVYYEAYEDYGFNIDSVKKAKVVSATARIKGEYENDKEKITLYMVKIDSAWKVLSVDYYS